MLLMYLFFPACLQEEGKTKSVGAPVSDESGLGEEQQALFGESKYDGYE